MEGGREEGGREGALLEMSCKILQGVPKACKILTSSCKLLEHLARSYKTFLVGREGGREGERDEGGREEE